MRPRYVRVGNCTVSTNNEKRHSNVHNEFKNRKNGKVVEVDMEPLYKARRSTSIGDISSDRLPTARLLIVVGSRKLEQPLGYEWQGKR